MDLLNHLKQKDYGIYLSRILCKIQAKEISYLIWVPNISSKKMFTTWTATLEYINSPPVFLTMTTYVFLTMTTYVFSTQLRSQMTSTTLVSIGTGSAQRCTVLVITSSKRNVTYWLNNIKQVNSDFQLNLQQYNNYFQNSSCLIQRRYE